MDTTSLSGTRADLLVVVQELGREGVVPFSSRIASNKPWGAPLAGLLAQYLVSCTFLFFVPPGDAYFFMISCETPSSYPSKSQLTNVSSCVVLLEYRQRPRLAGSLSAIHSTSQRMGLGSTIQSEQGSRSRLPQLEHLLARCSFYPAFARTGSIPKPSILGGFLIGLACT